MNFISNRSKSRSKSRKDSQGRSGIYFAGGGVSGSLPRNGSHNGSSQSPVRKLMEDITSRKVHIDENTKVLINGSELLSNKGITGKINKVGVGFGTGRHTSSRKTESSHPNIVKVLKQRKD